MNSLLQKWTTQFLSSTSAWILYRFHHLNQLTIITPNSEVTQRLDMRQPYKVIHLQSVHKPISFNLHMNDDVILSTPLTQAQCRSPRQSVIDVQCKTAPCNCRPPLSHARANLFWRNPLAQREQFSSNWPLDNHPVELSQYYSHLSAQTLRHFCPFLSGKMVPKGQHRRQAFRSHCCPTYSALRSHYRGQTT